MLTEKDQAMRHAAKLAADRAVPPPRQHLPTLQAPLTAINEDHRGLAPTIAS
jgi:hypothetical protein